MREDPSWPKYLLKGTSPFIVLHQGLNHIMSFAGDKLYWNYSTTLLCIPSFLSCVSSLLYLCLSLDLWQRVESLELSPFGCWHVWNNNSNINNNYSWTISIWWFVKLILIFKNTAFPFNSAPSLTSYYVDSLWREMMKCCHRGCLLYRISYHITKTLLTAFICSKKLTSGSIASVSLNWRVFTLASKVKAPQWRQGTQLACFYWL